MNSSPLSLQSFIYPQETHRPSPQMERFATQIFFLSSSRSQQNISEFPHSFFSHFPPSDSSILDLKFIPFGFYSSIVQHSVDEAPMLPRGLDPSRINFEYGVMMDCPTPQLSLHCLKTWSRATHILRVNLIYLFIYFTAADDSPSSSFRNVISRVGYIHGKVI